MSCAAEWGGLLSRYVDGEVTPDEKHLVDSHCTSCEPCRNSLELFKRNEKVLESALAGEAFGDMVVDEVMAEIRRLETPPVVAPALGGKTSVWMRVRRWWPAAAAAATVLLSMGVVLALRPPDTRDQVTALMHRYDEMRNENTSLRTAQLDLSVQLDEYKLGANRTKIGYVRQWPAVRGVFPGTFDRYELRRSADAGKTWKTLATDLKEPYFEDRSTEEGTTYDYQFIGHGKDDPVEAAPIRMRVPIAGGLDPLTSLRITFVGATNDRRTALFEIQRYVDGQPRSQKFSVMCGERIGTDEFATQLVLEAVVLSDEMYVWGGRAITRENKLAKLRAGGATLDLWRDSFKLVPLPK